MHLYGVQAPYKFLCTRFLFSHPVDDTGMRILILICVYSVVSEHVYGTKKAAWKRRRSARNKPATATFSRLKSYSYTLASIRECFYTVKSRLCFKIYRDLTSVVIPRIYIDQISVGIWWLKTSTLIGEDFLGFLEIFGFGYTDERMCFYRMNWYVFGRLHDSLRQAKFRITPGTIDGVV